MKPISPYVLLLVAQNHFATNANLFDLFGTISAESSSFKSDTLFKSLPTHTPTSQPTAKCIPHYSYIGCFKDGTPRAMEYQFLGVGYDPQSCFNVAIQAKYLYFSLQSGGECWATNILSMATEYGLSNQCNLKCNNQNSDYPGNCGGSMTNALYSITSCNPTIPRCNETKPYIGNTKCIIFHSSHYLTNDTFEKVVTMMDVNAFQVVIVLWTNSFLVLTITQPHAIKRLEQLDIHITDYNMVVNVGPRIT